ncbi:GmrSD restriction endonuclease domain-containing protein [Corynebacterium freiburgense]|uniref:GmrSD restriction endonuclease domain-containing protein n=1 Tax=Corynebacterium freiburgense TaxID=556548 RepID=UPI003B846D4D
MAGACASLVVVLGVLLHGCAPLPIEPGGPAAPGPQSFPDLDALPVKGRAPKTGYERELFGQAWTDDVTVEGGRNGCDTRNDILRRDLVDITLKPGTSDCVVLTGTLIDPYTTHQIAFQRGEHTSPAVQIDHIVSLSNAWQTGAQQLTPEQRRDFANDPRNLIAVDGPTNQHKGDGDAATWLPPNKAFRCEYIQRQITVKTHYGLWVTQAEKDAMARVLTTCNTETPGEIPAPAPEDEPLYRNCKEAWHAGVAPIHKGQPGYRTDMDGDGDGIACEPRR